MTRSAVVHVMELCSSCLVERSRKCIVKFQEKTGYSYHLGRNLIKSEYGAILDALMQIESYHSQLLIYVKEFQEEIQKEKNKIITDSSESKVDFFTMVR